MNISYLRRTQGWLLTAYAKAVSRTASYKAYGMEHLTRLNNSNRPIIVTTWHGQTLMVITYFDIHKQLDKYIALVDAKPKGAVVDTWLKRICADRIAISMDGNPMTAGRRLFELIRRMKQGNNLLINPDGPDGPSHIPKKGVAFIARKAKAVILPVGTYTATAYRLPRWDKYTGPFPFSRITIVFGKPIEISRKEDTEQALVLLTKRLNEAGQSAIELYHKK